MWFYAYIVILVIVVFFFKQKTAYEMRIGDWSSDVCSSDLEREALTRGGLKIPEADALGVIECGDALREKLGAAEVNGLYMSGPQLGVGDLMDLSLDEIERASCRERVCQYV